jgi:hypothetical protein
MLQGESERGPLLILALASACAPCGTLSLLFGMLRRMRGDGSRVERRSVRIERRGGYCCGWRATATPSPARLRHLNRLFVFFVVVGQANRSAAKEVPSKEPYAFSKAWPLATWDAWVGVQGECLCICGRGTARVGEEVFKIVAIALGAETGETWGGECA